VTSLDRIGRNATLVRVLRTEWVVNLDSLVVAPRTLRQSLRRWNRRRRGKLTHFLWELEAIKPAR